MSPTIRPSTLVFGILASLLLAGCAGSGALRHNNPQEAYERGLELYERERYDRAAEHFQAVFDFGRAHEWASDAQYHLAQSYYHNKDYILAASEFSRFSELYRSDPRVPEAEYWRAMAYYQLSPSFQLDQTDTERAIDQFVSFIERFPDHPRTDDATERIFELQEKLARKVYESARMYERREYYEAAALEYERAFDEYATTQWADDALIGAIRAWLEYAERSVALRQAERLQRAADAYQRLIQVFPDSPLIREAETLYQRVASRLEELNESETSQVHADALAPGA